MSFNALPCPFCGGFAEPVTQRWGPAGLQREYHGIVCDGDCLTFFDCRAPTVADAIAAWNVRATPAENSADDRLSEAKECLETRDEPSSQDHAPVRGSE